MVTQPVLYLLLVGNGIASSMSFRQAPGETSYLTFMYPGVVGMSILFTSIFSAIGIIWDREFGFLKEVLVAPVPRWSAAAGKALGITTLVTLQAAVLLLLAPLAKVHLGVMVVLKVLGVAALVGFTLGCLGIAIASRMRTLESFQVVMNVLTMPLFFLSGALFPLRGLPGWLSALSHADPLTYGVDALRAAIYSGGEPARALVQYSLPFDLAVLSGIAVILAAIAASSFERQPA
jgi:ABC-2 type transport system permease protein